MDKSKAMELVTQLRKSITISKQTNDECVAEYYSHLPLVGRTIFDQQQLLYNALKERKINPKRMQREINSQLEKRGIGTKAQQALKLQYEQSKIERKTQSREQKEAEKERQYVLRQEKKKEKHRGR